LIVLLVMFLLSASFGGRVASAESELAHPRLYFNQNDLDYLRELRSSPSHQAIWNNIKSWADDHISDLPPDEPSGGGVWWQVADSITRHIETMSFMFAMTEDPAYANAAKDWMLSVADWNKWDGSEESGQCVCTIAIGMAFGYDVLHDYLSPAERETLANEIARHVNITYNSWVSRNWREYYYGVSLRAAGFGLAGLGLLDDHPDAGSWLSLGIEMAGEELSRGGADGGQSEGLDYASYGQIELISFLDALKRVEGQDMFNNNYLRNNAYYFIYGTYNEHPLQFEDCNWIEGYYGLRLAFIYRLAAEYNDSHAQWFADTYADQSVMRSYIWKDPNLTATLPVGLSLTKHFGDMGYVISRTGWGANDLLFAFKSGSSRGHAHPSQNEFSIYYQGKPITCGPGYVCGGSEDDTWSHNCLLVDGNGQGQEPGDYQSLPLGTTGVIEQVDVHDPYYRYILGDASAPYNGGLDKWLRHIVFVENPGYFIVYDEVSAMSAKQFDWLLQAPKVGNDTASISVTGNTITLLRDDVKLVVDVLEPASFSYSIIPYNNPYGPSSYIELHPGEKASNVHFLTVHFPLTVNGSALDTEQVNVGNLIGAKAIDEDNLDLILFSADGNPVDQWIDLEGYYNPADGDQYEFEGTQVRAQFDSYQVMRLETQTGTNQPSVLNPIGNKSASESELLQSTIPTTDPDDSLTYSASNLPQGASFDPQTRTSSWTPDEAGIYPSAHFETPDSSLIDSEDLIITVKRGEWWKWWRCWQLGIWLRWL
jgi:hypothetical protein